jgi:hypothetical protein
MNADQGSEVVVNLTHGVGDLIPRLESPLFAFLLVLVATFGPTSVVHWFDHYRVRRHRSGRYVGVCGRDIVPASLTTPDGAACHECALWAGDRP